MVISLKELEKAIAYIRKNSGSEHISIELSDYGKETIITCTDLSSKIMTIHIYDSSTSKMPEIKRFERL